MQFAINAIIGILLWSCGTGGISANYPNSGGGSGGGGGGGRGSGGSGGGVSGGGGGGAVVVPLPPPPPTRTGTVGQNKLLISYFYKVCKCCQSRHN
ncbi:hypothetical protein PV326_007730, partial [Microctonus aethiopoides]